MTLENLQRLEYKDESCLKKRKKCFLVIYHMNRILDSQEIVNYHMKTEVMMFGEH